MFTIRPPTDHRDTQASLYEHRITSHVATYDAGVQLDGYSNTEDITRARVARFQHNLDAADAVLQQTGT